MFLDLTLNPAPFFRKAARDAGPALRIEAGPKDLAVLLVADVELLKPGQECQLFICGKRSAKVAVDREQKGSLRFRYIYLKHQSGFSGSDCNLRIQVVLVDLLLF